MGARENIGFFLDLAEHRRGQTVEKAIFAFDG